MGRLKRCANTRKLDNFPTMINIYVYILLWVEQLSRLDSPVLVGWPVLEKEKVLIKNLKSFFRIICGTLVHHSSVNSLSKKYAWFYTNLCPYEQITCIGGPTVHIFNQKVGFSYGLTDGRDYIIYTVAWEVQGKQKINILRLVNLEQVWLIFYHLGLLLCSQCFGRCIPWSSSGVSCRTREPTWNFEPNTLFNPQGKIGQNPLTITRYKC